MAAKKKKASGKKARNRAMRRQRIGKYALLGSVGLLAIGIVFAGWQLYRGQFVEMVWNGVRNGIGTATASSGFGLKHIAVDGRERTDKALLMQAMQLKHGESLLTLSLADLEARIKTLTTVRSVSIERQLPDALHIRLTERTPMAVWQYQGKLAVVDRDGIVLKEEDPARYPHLLLIVGKQAPERLEEMMALLKGEPTLASQVAAAIRVGERRWDIKMQNGTRIMLPEAHAERAWRYLADLQRTRQILSENIRQIDLRLDDKAYIRLTPQQNPDDKATAPASDA